KGSRTPQRLHTAYAAPRDAAQAPTGKGDQPTGKVGGRVVDRESGKQRSSRALSLRPAVRVAGVQRATGGGGQNFTGRRTTTPPQVPHARPRIAGFPYDGDIRCLKPV